MVQLQLAASVEWARARGNDERLFLVVGNSLLFWTRYVKLQMWTTVLARTWYRSTHPLGGPSAAPVSACIPHACYATLQAKVCTRFFFAWRFFFHFFFYFLIESQPVLKRRPLWYAIALSLRRSRANYKSTHSMWEFIRDLRLRVHTISLRRHSVAMRLARNCSRRPRTKYAHEIRRKKNGKKEKWFRFAICRYLLHSLCVRACVVRRTSSRCILPSSILLLLRIYYCYHWNAFRECAFLA